MKKIKRTAVLMLLLLFAPVIYGATVNTEQLYLNGRFADILSFFEANEKRTDFQALTLTQKLLYIECLARTNKGRQAEQKLKPLLNAHPENPEVMATQAIIHFSMGRLEQSKTLVQAVLAKTPKSPRALLTHIMLQLYYREFQQAAKIYKTLTALDPKWANSDLLFIVGLDLYHTMGNGGKLGQMYKNHTSGTGYSAQNRKENLKADYKMYKKAAKQPLLSIHTTSGKVEIPFDPSPGNIRVNTIIMTVKGIDYKVLLDTGNATGWLVHSRKLRDLLKPRKGGRTVSRIGSQASLLTGYRQWYKKLDFNGFSLLNADGVYVPKPHPSFPDANLNPLCIRDRVITLDFKNQKFILRTPQRFEKDMAVRKGTSKPIRLPWYGYKHALIPIAIKNQPGLAMLETGAEDIALKLEFAKNLELPMTPLKKFLGNGSVLQYHKTPLTLDIRGLILKRSNAEVWPFDRFYHPITGLTPDVIIGPKAMDKHFIISFDPFNRLVYIASGGQEPF
jgi:hypothetical protein